MFDLFSKARQAEELKKQMTAKDIENSDLKNRISSLQHRVEGKEQENSDLKNQISSLQHRVEIKEQDNSNLKRDLELQSNQNDMLRYQFHEYQKMEIIKDGFHNAGDLFEGFLRFLT